MLKNWAKFLGGDYMKVHRILALLFAVFILLNGNALAMSQEEWDQECRAKTYGTATLYAIERAPNASDTSLSVQMKEIGSLPVGTYVKTGQFDYDLNMWQIAYLKDGSLCEAWVEKNKVVGAYTVIYFDDGSCGDVPEAVVKDPDALLRLLKKLFPNRSYSTITGSSPIHVEQPQPDATPLPVKDPNMETSREVTSDRKGQLGNAFSNDNGVVTVKELGTHTSKVSYQGTTMEVSTAELNFGKDVPEDKKLAIIYTPRTGKASLRKSASDNADILKQCKAGVLVSVLEYGETYSMINYKNTNGYILTDCLKFHGVAAETEVKGVLSYNGKVSGGTTINIRLEADGGSRKIGEFKTGTEVTLIQNNEEWCEIEVKGIRGFLMTRYVTILD